MAPTPQGKGAYSSGGTTSQVIDADGIGGIQANDILIIATESTDGNTAAGTPNVPTNWSLLFEETQGAGATGVTTFSLFGKVATGSEADTTVDGVGNHISGTMFAIRGASPSLGDIVVGTGSGGNTSPASINSINTPVNDCLILMMVGTTRDSLTSTTFSAWTNSNLTGITEWEDNCTNTGSGGGIGVAYGVAASAGAIGSSSVTLTAVNWRAVHLGFRPAVLATKSRPKIISSALVRASRF